MRRIAALPPPGCPLPTASASPSPAGIRKDVEFCMRNARYLRKMLEKAGVKCMLNELSSTVVFERPEEEEFIRKWQLACEGSIAHVVVMPNVDVRWVPGG